MKWVRFLLAFWLLAPSGADAVPRPGEDGAILLGDNVEISMYGRLGFAWSQAGAFYGTGTADVLAGRRLDEGDYLEPTIKLRTLKVGGTVKATGRTGHVIFDLGPQGRAVFAFAPQHEFTVHLSTTVMIGHGWVPGGGGSATHVGLAFPVGADYHYLLTPKIGVGIDTAFLPGVFFSEGTPFFMRVSLQTGVVIRV